MNNKATTESVWYRSSLFGLFCIALTLIIGTAFVIPVSYASSGQEVEIYAGSGSGPACAPVGTCFVPDVLTISAGTTVTWINDDSVGHTVTSGKPTDTTTGTEFDSSIISAGAAYQLTFSAVGTYDYFDMIHPWMQGEIIVTPVTQANSQQPTVQTTQSSNQNSQYVNQFEQLKQQSWGYTHPISYAVYYVTSQDSCTDTDYKALKYYQVISDEYLSLYQIQHDLASSLCIPQKDLVQYLSGLDSSTLPIVIMDNAVGNQLLLSQNYYGLYTISGTGKESIVVCACDNEAESWTGGWVLSHELSHFALHYYGTPETVYVNWVHYVQALENECQNGDFTKVCSDYSTAVTSPSGNQIPVMEIYGQGPTSYNMPSNPPQSEITLLTQQMSQLQPNAQSLGSTSTPEFGSTSVLVFTLVITGLILIRYKSNHLSNGLK